MCYVQRAFNFPYTRGGFGEPIQNLFKFKDDENGFKDMIVVVGDKTSKLDN